MTIQRQKANSCNHNSLFFIKNINFHAPLVTAGFRRAAANTGACSAVGDRHENFGMHRRCSVCMFQHMNSVLPKIFNFDTQKQSARCQTGGGGRKRTSFYPPSTRKR